MSNNDRHGDTTDALIAAIAATQLGNPTADRGQTLDEIAAEIISNQAARPAPVVVGHSYGSLTPSGTAPRETYGERAFRQQYQGGFAGGIADVTRQRFASIRTTARAIIERLTSVALATICNGKCPHCQAPITTTDAPNNLLAMRCEYCFRTWEFDADTRMALEIVANPLVARTRHLFRPDLVHPSNPHMAQPDGNGVSVLINTREIIEPNSFDTPTRIVETTLSFVDLSAQSHACYLSAWKMNQQRDAAAVQEAQRQQEHENRARRAAERAVQPRSFARQEQVRAQQQQTPEDLAQLEQNLQAQLAAIQRQRQSTVQITEQPSGPQRAERSINLGEDNP